MKGEGGRVLVALLPSLSRSGRGSVQVGAGPGRLREESLGGVPCRGCPSAPLAVGGMGRCGSPSAFTGLLLQGTSRAPASLCGSEPGYLDA